MKIYNYPSKTAETRVAAISNRGLGIRKKDILAVERILTDVQKNGDEALIRYTSKYDSPGIRAEELMVTKEEFREAAKQVDRGFTRALNRAKSQIEKFHRRQLKRSWIDTQRPGVILGQINNPVSRAGVYVPGGQGGQTPLVSSVLMGVIPAKIAGVQEVIMVTPATREKCVNPFLLTAARKVGVDAVYKVGSAWAIAAMAYGTETVPAVDVVVGPGNIYVTLAKKMVSGTVGIDMIAGPSEILVIADHTARPEFVAADLLSQAEHDRLASAIMVTDSVKTAQAVLKAVHNQLENLHRREIAEESIAKFGAIFVTPGLNEAIDLANRIAPEHLELMIAKPFEYVGRIRNAGAVFMGDYTPEPVGDYMAGPNHVLPTAGTARFSSALSVDNFMKKTSIIHYSEGAFRKEASDIMRLAEVEGLGAHANSVQVRLTGKTQN